GVRYIYKYQSAAKILGTVSETDPNPAFPEHTDHRFVPYGGISDPPVITPENHLICVYSPIGHALKTTLCLTLGELLSKEAKVLYINMEGYSGLEKMLGIRNQRNFSDLIYDHTLNGEDVLHALQSYLKEKNGLWYMVPSSEAELQEMEPEQLLAVLSFLDNSSGFDHILLDPGPCVRGLTELLKLCGLVLMPVRSDRISMAKIDEFREFLASAPGKTGGDPAGSSLTERFRELKLPFFEEIGKEQRMGLRSSKILADHLRKEGLLSTIAYTRKPKP
ncbi:MAG: hypothetical protein K6G83_07430, partial [Lachnospiraceae bacterium]|nr:hypothetical protein [Lachnospiraceae bacterium]